MCGHCYHLNCLGDTDKSHYECIKCASDLANKIEIMDSLKAKVKKSNEFFEKIDNNKNKFDVIAEFMGRGLFGTFSQEEERDEEEREGGEEEDQNYRSMDPGY